MFEDLPNTLSCFPEIASDNRLVPHDEERRVQCIGYSFGQRRLTIPRRSGEQYAIARLQIERTQQVGAAVFLDQFADCLFGLFGQNQVFDSSFWNKFDNKRA